MLALWRAARGGRALPAAAAAAVGVRALPRAASSSTSSPSSSSSSPLPDGAVCKHLSVTPEVGQDVFIAPSASVMGAVTLGDESSVFYGAVLRADINTIRIGKRSNVQDGTVIHLASNKGVTVGEDVTIGHRAMLHACDIGDRVLIGMSATIMDHAVIGEDSIVAAGALVTTGKKFPPGSLIVGCPARRVRLVLEEEKAMVLASARKYVKVQREHHRLMFDMQTFEEFDPEEFFKDMK